MSFKFPFTNYHELNLTWVLDQLKKLFEESAENVSTIQNYDGRLTAVETELPVVSENASEASRVAAAAGSLAQTATQKADTAQENAVQAQGMAGTARREAEAAQTAANEATQAAQQAQATAQNFDGRITEAQNNASQALEASRSFENRVQSAITTANNAARTASDAQGVAQNANQNAAAALDKIGDLSALDTTAKQNLVAAINEALENGGGDTSNCAPLIINTASGNIASFSDGADNRQIRKIVATIEPVQEGTGDPSPDNVRPISGWTGANIVVSPTTDAADGVTLPISWETEAGTVYSGTVALNQDGSADVVSRWKYYDGGDITWAKNASSYKYGTFYASGDFLSSGHASINVISSHYKGESNDSASASADNYCWIRYLSSSNRQLQVKDTSKDNMSVSEFKQAMTGVGFLVRSTAISYHFDNIGQLKTFLEANNVWCDTGDITELTYPADTKLYIDGKIAELQALMLENNG